MRCGRRRCGGRRSWRRRDLRARSAIGVHRAGCEHRKCSAALNDQRVAAERAGLLAKLAEHLAKRIGALLVDVGPCHRDVDPRPRWWTCGVDLYGRWSRAVAARGAGLIVVVLSVTPQPVARTKKAASRIADMPLRISGWLNVQGVRPEDRCAVRNPGSPTMDRSDRVS